MRRLLIAALGCSVLLAVAATAVPPFGRGPTDQHGIIPMEVVVDGEPRAGQEIRVRARVAPGGFPDGTGCPVYAWVVEPGEAGRRPREVRLKAEGKAEKTRRVRELKPGQWETTEPVRFKLEPQHAGKELRVQVRPSRGGQLDRSASFLIR